MNIVCPKCGYSNNGIDKICAKCSAGLPDGSPIIRRKRFRVSIYPLHVFIVVFALATLGYFIFGAGNWTTPSEQIIETPDVPDEASIERDNSAEAWIIMCDFMKEKVRTPGTASFPKLGESRTRVTKLPNAAYEVLGYVDFEGEGNKRVRRYFKGKVIQYREGLWKLDSYEMDFWDAMARYFVGME